MPPSCGIGPNAHELTGDRVVPTAWTSSTASSSNVMLSSKLPSVEGSRGSRRRRRLRRCPRIRDQGAIRQRREAAALVDVDAVVGRDGYTGARTPVLASAVRSTGMHLHGVGLDRPSDSVVVHVDRLDRPAELRRADGRRARIRWARLVELACGSWPSVVQPDRGDALPGRQRRRRRR